MKYSIVVLCLCLFSEKGQAQLTVLSSILGNLQQNDTLYINFYVATGEFGSMHKGLLLYKKDSAFFIRYVLYNYGVSLRQDKLIEIHPMTRVIPLERDSIFKFYKEIKNNYFVLKNDRKLEEKEIRCLRDYFLEFEKFNSNGWSNAPEFYAVMDRKNFFLIIDREGKWKKFSKLKKVLNL